MAAALDRIRVVEVGEGKALAYAGKLLRDLGAEVIKIEPPGGDSMRDYGPFPSDDPSPDQSGMFIFLNGGKRGTRLDIEADHGNETLVSLLEGADVLLHSFQPLMAKKLGLDSTDLLERYPRLIVSAVTPYGSTGPYAEWRGYAIQAHAGATVALRNGAPDRGPLTSALDMAEIQHGAVHLATATALALVHRNRTGRGQFVDISVMEAAQIALSGGGGPRAIYGNAMPPPRMGRYFSAGPFGVFTTKDGAIAALPLLDRQWHDFIDVMGNPEWASDPRFVTVENQAMNSRTQDDRDEAAAYMDTWFGERNNGDVWELMRRGRIPFHPVHTVGEVVESDHMKERGFLIDAPGPHPTLRVPGVPYRMSATKWMPPGVPPTLDGEVSPSWTSEPLTVLETHSETRSQPLEGVRVIDLGQVWAGPLLGRYLADYGTDSIIVDTATRPRTLAGSLDPTDPWAWEGYYRNRRSVQLDLKTSKGVELFKGLLQHSDIMIDNFTPRVLPSFGLDYEDLAAEFPKLIIAALSAGGRSGDWSDVLTYGPTLSGLYGLKSLNGYPEDQTVMEDGAYLDPISGTYGMLAIMSALHHRDRTGEGQMIEIAQGELGVIGVTEAVIEHVWNGRNMGPQGNLHRVLAPHGIYQCAGDNQWIAIACGSDEEWTALAKTAGHAEWLDRNDFRTAADRRAARLELDSLIGDWTISKEPVALTEELQGAGVAAMTALGVFEMLADDQHSHRRDHFDLADEYPGDRIMDGNPWHLSEASPRASTSAPEPGQHNEEVFGELLGLASTEIRDLQAEGVIG